MSSSAGGEWEGFRSGGPSSRHLAFLVLCGGSSVEHPLPETGGLCQELLCIQDKASESLGEAHLPGTTLSVPSQIGGAILSRTIQEIEIECEVVGLPEADIADRYERYKQKYGDFPTPDSDVSKDQLSALAQVIAAGAVPYADFSLFGPFGQRLLRRQTHTAFQLNAATGEWSRKEQPGPADFHTWYRIWKCYRTALLLLEACEAERLDAYSEFIRSQVTQFGDDAWSFISQADSRLRSEHLDRLCRQLRPKANARLGGRINAPSAWGLIKPWVAPRQTDYRAPASAANTKSLQGTKRPASPKAPPTAEQQAAIKQARRSATAKSAPKKKTKPSSYKSPETLPSSSSKPAQARPDTKAEAITWVKDRPKGYGYWQAVGDKWDSKPRALILFAGRQGVPAGRSRSGLLRCPLVGNSLWDFQSLEGETSRPSTFEVNEGLPPNQLTESEQKQVKEANLLIKRTYTAAADQNRAKKPWGLENPKHPDDKPQIWQMPLIRKLAELRNVDTVDFDQYAAWLGRATALVSPSTGLQVYVDDPAMFLPGTFSEASREFSSVLLWFAAAGFPVKLEKAEGGKAISWVGATLVVDHESKEVTISIPKEKVEKLQETTHCFLKRPCHRQLRSYAGSLSFVAGLVPHLRPFLSSIWAALAGVSAANDGAPKRHSGKLLHTRRFKAALRWIEALLRGKPAPLSRVLSAKFIETEATITTDASPWGVGGVLRVNGRPLLPLRANARQMESPSRTTAAALAAMNNPEECVKHFKSGFQAETTKGPSASRRNLWHTLASKAGPVWPARAMLLAAWWLLREIEASRAKKKHISICEREKRATWRLPSSKTDQAALGAECSHTCNCSFSAPTLCPYHLMIQHMAVVQHDEDFLFQDDLGDKTTKHGWTATFQSLAKLLDLQIYNSIGAPLFTGHSARVTGARHLAAANIELWRIQLFGRWGSEVFLYYIQDTPLAQLREPVPGVFSAAVYPDGQRRARSLD
eukprot:s1115_g14.t1